MQLAAGNGGVWLYMQVHHRPSLLIVSCKPARRKLHLLVHPRGHNMYAARIESFKESSQTLYSTLSTEGTGAQQPDLGLVWTLDTYIEV